jgi:AcrR family transcriptional regulator
MNKRSKEGSEKVIFNAALKIFSEYGYEGAGMRMIASKAGMSVGSLYLRVKNKEQLFFYMMKRHFENVLCEVEKAIGKTTNPVDALKALIRTNMELAKENKAFFLAKNRSRHKLEMELKRDFFKTQRTFIEEIIGKGVKDGHFALCNQREAAKIVMSVIRGFIFSMVFNPDNLFSYEECSKLLMKGLLKRND